MHGLNLRRQRNAVRGAVTRLFEEAPWAPEIRLSVLHPFLLISNVYCMQYTHTLYPFGVRAVKVLFPDLPDGIGPFPAVEIGGVFRV